MNTQKLAKVTKHLRQYIFKIVCKRGGHLSTAFSSIEILTSLYFTNLLNDDSFTNELYLLPSGGAINANRTVVDNNSIVITVLYSDL